MTNLVGPKKAQEQRERLSSSMKMPNVDETNYFEETRKEKKNSLQLGVKSTREYPEESAVNDWEHLILVPKPVTPKNVKKEKATVSSRVLH